MMLPLTAISPLPVQGHAQAPASVLPGQTEPDLTDEQTANYALDLAALLQQLQPAELDETLQNAEPLPAEIPTHELVQSDETSEQLPMSLLHFSKQPGEYQLSQSFVMTGVQPELTEVTKPAQIQSVATDVAIVKGLLGAGVVAPPLVTDTVAAALSAVDTPVTPSALLTATDNTTLPQVSRALQTMAASATLDVAASERHQLTASALLTNGPTQLPAQTANLNSMQSQPLFAPLLQQNQQAALHSSLFRQTSLATQLLGAQAGLESSLLSTQSGISSAVSSSQHNQYQWQSEPMPADPVRFGQRLLALLSDKVDVQLGLGVNRAMIRLDPPSLGSIELAIQLDGEKLTVQLNSSNLQLKEAMQQGLEQLRASLQLRMGIDAQIELRMGSDAQSQQQRDQQAQAQHEIAANIAGVENAEDAEAAKLTTTGLVNQLV